MRPLRLGEEKKKKERKKETGQKYNVRICYQGGHKNNSHHNDIPHPSENPDV